MRNLKASHLGLILGAFASSFATAGCTEDVDSKDIRTSGMYAEFSAVADGSGGTTLRARLKVGGDDSNTYIDVKDEDTLIGTVGAEEKELDEVGRQRYGAAFKADEGGTKINIALDRGESDDGAPKSQATLPEPFELTLVSDKIIRRGEPIAFSWDPADGSGEMNWILDDDKDCVFLASGRGIADDGAFSIPAGDHKQLGDEDDGEECTVVLRVERVVQGTVDSAYDGGEFAAVQRRTVAFTSVGPDAKIKKPAPAPASDAGTEPDPAPEPAETDAGTEPAPEPAQPDAGNAAADAGQ